MWQLLALSLFGISIEYNRFYTEAFMYHLYKHILNIDPEDTTFSDNVIQAVVGNPFAPIKILIIGDSMALSCGAKTHEAKLHRKIVDTYKDRVYVHTIGKFGAKTTDIPLLIEHLPKHVHFDTTLLFIGANDIVHLHFFHFTKKLRVIAELLHARTDTVCWAIGDPDMVPIITKKIRLIINWVNKRAQRIIKKHFSHEGLTFLHIMKNNHDDPFRKHPEIYFSADGYHPSDVGYLYIFKRYNEEILHSLLKRHNLL
jgi:lysophospholipase L1-like esterase